MRPRPPVLDPDNNEQCAFSEEEIAYLDAGRSVALNTQTSRLMAERLKNGMQSEDWDEVQKCVVSLLCTPVKQGLFHQLIASGLGTVVKRLFLMRVDERNSFAVRLATLLVGYWDSAIEFIKDQRLRTCQRRPPLADKGTGKRRRVV